MWKEMTDKEEANQDVIDGDEVSFEIHDYSCANWFETMVDEVEKFLVESFEKCDNLRPFTRGINEQTRIPQKSSEDDGISMPSFSSDLSRKDESEGDDDGITGCKTSWDVPPPSPFVVGCTFPIRIEQGQRRVGTVWSAEGTHDEVDLALEENIRVEIHAHDPSHPIARLFCLPLFLLIKNVALNTYYRASESALYLSILSTAAGNAFSDRLQMNLNGGKRVQGADELPSLFSFHDGCIPCFVPTGDEYQQTFEGFAPPGLGSTMVFEQDAASSCGASQNQTPTIAQMLLQPLLTTRFRCNAYGQRPEGCLYLSDLVNLFQLHLGPCSRMEMYDFKGMCISVSKRFELSVPWRFRHIEPHPEFPAPSTLRTPDETKNEGYTWRELLKRENEEMVRFCGPHFLPFGTDVAPVEKLFFDFTWNQLHDYEAREDANFSLVDPFALATSPSAEEVNRKCSILARAIARCETSLYHPSCVALDKFGSKILDYMQDHWDSMPQPVSAHEAPADHFNERGEEFQNEVMSFTPPGSETHQILIDELAKEDFVCSDGDKTNGGAELLNEFLNRQSQLPVGERTSKASNPGSLKDLRHAYFPGSLLTRLAHVAMNRLFEVEDIFHTWNYCMREVQIRLDSGKKEDISFVLNCIRLPVREPVVDITQSLLVQKLQLLVYCLRAMLLEMDEPHPQNAPKVLASAKGSDENSNFNIGLEKDTESVSQLSMPHAIAEQVPPIAPEAHSNSDGWNSSNASFSGETTVLITNGEPLVKPPVLPQIPTTFDTITQRAIDLNNLDITATVQSPSVWLHGNGLYNDMCLFLYVNEAHNGRVVRFPDFVHWHSPRDFKLPAAPSSDDNDYLSERMRILRPNPEAAGCTDAGNAGDGSNLWWVLWTAAVPRSGAEITADAFRPRAEAALVLRWLVAAVPRGMLLHDVLDASLSNALHPMLSHPAGIGRRGRDAAARMPGGLNRKGPERARAGLCAAALRAYLRARSHAIAGGLAGGEATSRAGLEGVRGARARALRGVAEVETALCAALAVGGVVGWGELAGGLSAPTEKQPRGGRLSLAACPVALSWWSSWLCRCFQKEREKHPREVRVRLACMAERPLNTSGCFQQLVMEKQGSGEFRLGLALSQEVL